MTPRLLKYCRAPRMALPALVVLATGCSTSSPPPAEPFPVPPFSAAVLAPSTNALPSGPLTVEEAVRRALDASDVVAVLRAAVTVAEERRRAATDLGDPELRLSYGSDTTKTTRDRTTADPVRGVTERDSGSVTEDGTAASAGLRLFPPNPWVLPAKLNAADADLNAARADLAAAEWSMAIGVRRLVAEILFLGKDVAVLRQLADDNRQVLEAVRLRAQQNDATVGDVMTASRRYLGALSDRDRAARKASAQQRVLASLLDLPAASLRLDSAAAVLVITNAAFSASAAADFERIALRHRADLAALYWRSAMAKSLYKAARAEGLPWFKMIQGDFSSANSDSDGIETSTNAGPLKPGASPFSNTRVGDTSDGRSWQVSAAINIPLFSWMNSADNVRRAESDMARIREAQALKILRRQLADALEDLRDVQMEWALYLAETEPLVLAMQSAMRDLRGEQQLTTEEAAAIRIQILQAQRTRLEATYNYTLAVIAFEEALGARISRAGPSRQAAP